MYIDVVIIYIHISNPILYQNKATNLMAGLRKVIFLLSGELGVLLVSRQQYMIVIMTSGA